MIVIDLEFLNENSGAIIAFAAILYAYLTWRLVSETKKLREAQTEPKISVNLQPKEDLINFIDMIIQNIGLGPAYNIKFKINPDFEYMKGKFLSESNFMKKGLNYLAPNQKYKFFLTSMLENLEEKIKTPFEITVTYQNKKGKTYDNNYTIDLSELAGLLQLGESPLYKIAKNMEKIQTDINYLSRQYKQRKEGEEKREEKGGKEEDRR